MNDNRQEPEKIEPIQQNTNSDKKKSDENYMVIGMILGMCIGMTVGQFIFQNLATGMSVGTGLGLAIGINIKKKK